MGRWGGRDAKLLLSHRQYGARACQEHPQKRRLVVAWRLCAPVLITHAHCSGGVFRSSLHQPRGVSRALCNGRGRIGRSAGEHSSSSAQIVGAFDAHRDDGSVTRNVKSSHDMNGKGTLQVRGPVPANSGLRNVADGHLSA